MYIHNIEKNNCFGMYCKAARYYHSSTHPQTQKSPDQSPRRDPLPGRERLGSRGCQSGDSRRQGRRGHRGSSRTGYHHAPAHKHHARGKVTKMAATTLLEKFWRISLHVTGHAILHTA